MIFVIVAAVILLIAIAGLLAAADAAIMQLSHAQLCGLAAESARGGQHIGRIAADEAAHLNALSFARVLAQTLAAVLITLAVGQIIHELWLQLLVATLFMTAITFVLVGSSPRTIGTHHPERIIRFSALWVRAVRILVGPFAQGLIRLGDLVTPARGSGGGRIRDEKQLLSFVDRAAEQQVLEDDDRDYIHSLVRLGDTFVRELMVPRLDMVTVSGVASVRETLETLLAARHSRAPVLGEDSDEVVGVAHLRDASGFVLRRREDADVQPITRIMKPALFVPELQRADELLRQMQRENTHLAVVVDEYGGVAGLVTLEDLLEELLGDIHDEHDREQADVQPLEDGGFLVTARLSTRELGELFGFELDDDEVDTVGGLIAKHLERLPETGDTVTVAGLTLRAERCERKHRRIVSASVRLAIPVSNGEDGK